MEVDHFNLLNTAWLPEVTGGFRGFAHAADPFFRARPRKIVNASARPPVTTGCRVLDARRSLDQVIAKLPDISGAFGKYFISVRVNTAISKCLHNTNTFLHNIYWRRCAVPPHPLEPAEQLCRRKPGTGRNRQEPAELAELG